MDPEHEKIFWVSRLIRLSWISAVLPASIVSSNIEKLSHVEELKKISARWKEIRVPVTILHGKNDWIVPVKNAFFIDRMLANTTKKLVVNKKTGHLIPWTHPKLMKYEILEMAERY
jgi:pimeloyl-ACP methyl ester carboxylesterase